MGKKLIILFLFIIVNHASWSQQNSQQVRYDQQTYDLYLNQSWQALVVKGQEAIDAGFDFFYLRMRIGLAWYNLHRYEKAREHFQKAKEFTPDDETVDFYLYFSTLLSGRPGEARSLVEGFSENTINSIGARPKLSLSGIGAEYGTFSNNSLEDLRSSMPEGDYSTSYFLESMNYSSLSAGINLGYSSNLTISVNKYSLQNIQLIGFSGEMLEYPFSNSQDGLYLRYAYQFPGSWYGGVVYHGTRGNYGAQYYREVSEGVYEFQEQIESYQQSFFGAYLGTHFKNLDISLGVSENRFWQGGVYQIGVNMYYYPLGNTNLYFSTAYHNLIAGDTTQTDESVWKFLAGGKITKGIFVEASHIRGNMANWADIGGYYLYNTKYPIVSRSGISLIFSGLIPHLQFTLSGFSQRRQHQTDVFSLDGSYEYVLQEFTSTSIIGGLSWIF